MPRLLDGFFDICRSPLQRVGEIENDSSYEYTYETISVSCSESDREGDDSAEVNNSAWKARTSFAGRQRSQIGLTPVRGSFYSSRRASDAEQIEGTMHSTDDVSLSEERLKKREEFVFKEKLRHSIYHTGTFDTIKFKVVSYQKAKIMLDLNKNPPHLENGGQSFKVYMDKYNLLSNNDTSPLGRKSANCCMYRVSFLKTHWIAICLDPDSLDGPDELNVVASSCHRTLQREVKCESARDVINAAFCIHASTLRGLITDDKVCIIQHLLNKRFYACAALNYGLPEGRSVEKSDIGEVADDVPWFDMESDVVDLSLTVRSTVDAKLTSFMQLVNGRTPRQKKTKKIAAKVSSPRAIDPDIATAKSTSPKAKAKAKAKTGKSNGG